MTAVALAPTNDDAAALAACRRVIAQKSKSFSLAARLLPSACRDDVAVVYAFLRRMDDAIDLAPPHARSHALARMRAEVDAVYAGASLGEPILDAFAVVARRRAIPRLYVDELLAGMDMDVRRHAYASFDDLRLYCFRVAGVVGLLLCHVMGMKDAAALPNAAHLGIAMQLTNVCRDVEEDLEDGRVYLPRAMLGADLALVPSVDSPTRRAVQRVVRELLDRADRFYASADRGLVALPFRVALAVRVARRVYAAIGDRLRVRGCDPFATESERARVFVPLWLKLWLVLASFVASLRELPVRFRDRRRAAPPDRILRFEDLAPPSEES